MYFSPGKGDLLPPAVKFDGFNNYQERYGEKHEKKV